MNSRFGQYISNRMPISPPQTAPTSARCYNTNIHFEPPAMSVTETARFIQCISSRMRMQISAPKAARFMRHISSSSRMHISAPNSRQRSLHNNNTVRAACPFRHPNQRGSANSFRATCPFRHRRQRGLDRGGDTFIEVRVQAVRL